MLKKYQPERTDLLINTDWGIARDQLTLQEAKGKNLKLFHGRWVSREEKKQLKDEYHAYCSIRQIGFILVLFAIFVLINIGFIADGGISSISLVAIYALVMLASGIGLIKYARIACYFAILMLISFMALPFTLLLSSEKGAPFLIILGVVGLYYLRRRTAMKIFSPAAGAALDDRKNKRSALQNGIVLVALLITLYAGYIVFDVSQARRMTVDICNRATPGMPLEAFLSQFAKEDYKIIQHPEYVLIIPKRGLGRCHCMILNDGQNITDAKADFVD